MRAGLPLSMIGPVESISRIYVRMDSTRVPVVKNEISSYPRYAAGSLRSQYRI